MLSMKRNYMYPIFLGLFIYIVILCGVQASSDKVNTEEIVVHAGAHFYAATEVPQGTPQQVIIRVEGPSPTPTPVPTATPTPSPVPTPSGLLGGRYEGFSYEGVVETEDSYRSENISIQVYSVSDSTTYDDYIVYYVADIHIQNVELLRTEPYGKNFKSQEFGIVKKTAERVNAILACSGDYYVHNKGLLIRNGELYRNMKGRFDICVLYRDGTMRTFLPREYEKDEIIASDPWQVWSFGPALINNDGTPRRVFDSSAIASRNPRCMIGYYEPGHYALVLVDGRQSKYSMGLTLKDLAQLAYDLGFKVAYNLDGGRSAIMCWRGEHYNRPQGGGRSISDIIYIAPEQ